jgi:hypothetical protein
MEKEKRLLLLTQFWYEYVGCDHHKDRDCHFYINKKWSYGHPAVYYVDHYGYMSEYKGEGEFATYEEALDELLAFLEENAASAYKNIPSDWEDTSRHDYNWDGVMKVLKKYALHEIEFYQEKPTPLPETN